MRNKSVRVFGQCPSPAPAALRAYKRPLFSAMLRIGIEPLMYALLLKMDDEWMKRHSAHRGY
jgi:hypothetical protein